MTNIMLVGEAWGEKEAEARRPFVGASGWLLNQLLSHAGLRREDCYVTNVFNLRPRPSNDIKNLCGTKTESGPWPQLSKGKYIRKEFAGELERLYQEVRDVQPNLILALGATAAWAFMYSSGIKAVRGAIARSALAVTLKLGREYKILPTYHPAAILRDWSSRPIATADLMKAAREQHFPEVRRPQRLIWTEPTLQDLLDYEQQHLTGAPRVACDIETVGTQITCIGFSPRPDSAIVIPLFRGQNTSYWDSAEEEVAALRIIQRWLDTYPCVFQNGLFDLHVMWRYYGLRIKHDTEDTMLMHHAYMPELSKGLGFLGTLYTDEASWKHMRTQELKHD
jgi:uracil-DNA glycosylase